MLISVNPGRPSSSRNKLQPLMNVLPVILIVRHAHHRLRHVLVASQLNFSRLISHVMLIVNSLMRLLSIRNVTNAIRNVVNAEETLTIVHDVNQTTIC